MADVDEEGKVKLERRPLSFRVANGVMTTNLLADELAGEEAKDVDPAALADLRLGCIRLLAATVRVPVSHEEVKRPPLVEKADRQTRYLAGQEPLTANEAKLLVRLQELELRYGSLARKVDASVRRTRMCLAAISSAYSMPLEEEHGQLSFADLEAGGKLTKETSEAFLRRVVAMDKELENKLVEELAAYAHDAWSGWMRYMLPHLTTRVRDVDVPHAVQDRLSDRFDPLWHDSAQEKLNRWRDQMNTSYLMLTEEEKESDRKEARRMLEVIRQHATISPGVVVTTTAGEG